jgi:alkylation response protein AidB-like acyl-CoA dehydrogenase
MSAADLTEDSVRAFVSAHRPRRGSDEHVSTLGAGGYDLEGGRRYLAAMGPEGIGMPGWPVEHGGRGATVEEEAVIERVLEEFSIPDLYPFRVGLRMVGPTLLEFGTSAQQARWLLPIAMGREIWCQMFSEPEAGSDLANVAMSARRDGSHWVLNGQKVWTSRGAYADWGICLARTDPTVPKHQGLTMFAVAMTSPGVEVRPLVQMNGDVHFSEVFVGDTRLDDGCRIGAIGSGWKVAVRLLAHERAGGARLAARDSADQGRPAWLRVLAERGALQNPVLRDRAMAHLCYEEAVRYTEQRARNAGTGPGPSGSGLKLHGARTFKERQELIIAAMGAAGTLTSWPEYADFLTGPSISIRGGTDQIQLNVIGERILGLPKEPVVDRDLSWEAQRRAGRSSD